MRKWVYRIIRNTLALVGILVILEETFGFVGEETRCRPPERITDAIDNTESVLVFPFILPALGFVNAFKLVEKIKKKLKDLVREADRQAWHRVHEARSA